MTAAVPNSWTAAAVPASPTSGSPPKPNSARNPRQHVEGRDHARAADEGARQVAPGLLDLAGDVERRVPARVGEVDLEVGVAEGREPAGAVALGRRRGPVAQGLGRAAVAEHVEADEQQDQDRDDRDRDLNPAGDAHAVVVDDRQRDDQRRRQDPRRRDRQAEEGLGAGPVAEQHRQLEVRRRHGHASERAGEDHQQLQPPRRERDPVAPADVQELVVAARARAHRSELGQAQRPEQRRESADDPHRQEGPRPVDVGRDLRRHDEDPDAEHRARHERDRGQSGEFALLARVGRLVGHPCAATLAIHDRHGHLCAAPRGHRP